MSESFERWKGTCPKCEWEIYSEVARTTDVCPACDAATISYASVDIDHPTNGYELGLYISKHKDRIFVREDVDGRPQSVALGSLPGYRQVEITREWIEREFVPHRFIE